MSFTQAIKWSVLSELAAKAIQPVIFILLARLLSPEDFGVMSAALMVIGFSQIFWEAGMAKAIIQRQTDVDSSANAAFWINTGMGVVISGLLFISADRIATVFFHDERVASVLQVMSIQILLGSVSAVHVALLQKEMDFKKLFWVRFATVSLPGFASIPLAMMGLGYWALVVGTIVGQVAQVIMLWRLSQWRPRLSFQTQIAKELLQFGGWVAASGLLAWFYVWGDSLIVGMYLGSHELGLYRTGSQLAAMIFTIIFSPINPVLYSHLSRMNENKERMCTAAEKVIKVLTFAAVPIAMIVFSLSIPLGEVLFGPKWEGVGFVIGAMALMHGFSWVVGMNGEVYRAMGRPAHETIVTGSTLIIYFGAYLFSIDFGIEAFVWTRLSLALGSLLLHLLVIRALLSMPILPIISHLLLITAVSFLSVSLVYYFVTSNIIDAWLQVLAGGLTSVAVVSGALFVIGKNDVLKELTSFVRVRSK